jgi:hypothetical protein
METLDVVAYVVLGLAATAALVGASRVIAARNREESLKRAMDASSIEEARDKSAYGRELDVVDKARQAKESGAAYCVLSFESGLAAKVARDKLMLVFDTVDLVYKPDGVSVKVKF